METVAERDSTLQDAADQWSPSEVTIRRLLLNEPVRVPLLALRISTTRASTGGGKREAARGHGSCEIAVLDTCETAALDGDRKVRKQVRVQQAVGPRRHPLFGRTPQRSNEDAAL